jgi:predicted enzyme related to lactoylglutathione lyase
MQVVWVEIPVQDLDRALAFYQQVFDVGEVQIREEEVRRSATLVQTADGSRPGVSLTQTRNFEPSNKGPLVFLNTGDDLTPYLSRIESAGGTVVEAKTSMGEYGSYATFQDTEGNLLALYSYP